MTTHTAETNSVATHTPVAERHVRRVLLVLFAALMALVATGCELDEDPDAADADGVDAVGADATDTTDETALPYRYVRITDQSTKSSTINGGADIDAVILHKANGTQFSASTVEGFQHGGGHYEGPDLNPTQALGMPDSFYNWPSTGQCDADDGFVSLGGAGGYLILGMGAEIEAGDRIMVAEVGGCAYDGSKKAIAEPVQVEVGVARDVYSQWVYVGSGTGPVVNLSVPNLPERFAD